MQHEITPMMQHETTPMMQHETTPMMQHETTPLMQHAITPLMQHETTSMIPTVSPNKHGNSVTNFNLSTFAQLGCYEYVLRDCMPAIQAEVD